jgi:hypothetical protein
MFILRIGKKSKSTAFPFFNFRYTAYGHAGITNDLPIQEPGNFFGFEIHASNFSDAKIELN